MILLFGSIATVGLNTLTKNKIDIHQSRNLMTVAVTLVFGIGEFSLCGIVAILLNLILPKTLGAVDLSYWQPNHHTSQ